MSEAVEAWFAYEAELAADLGLPPLPPPDAQQLEPPGAQQLEPGAQLDRAALAAINLAIAADVARVSYMDEQDVRETTPEPVFDELMTRAIAQQPAVEPLAMGWSDLSDSGTSVIMNLALPAAGLLARPPAGPTPPTLALPSPNHAVVGYAVDAILGRSADGVTSVLSALAGTLALADVVNVVAGVTPGTVVGLIRGAFGGIRGLVAGLVGRFFGRASAIVGGAAGLVPSLLGLARGAGHGAVSMFLSQLFDTANIKTVTTATLTAHTSPARLIAAEARIKDLDKSHGKWVGPVRLAAKGIGPVGAISLGAGVPIPLSLMLAGGLLVWDLMLTGDMLDARGPYLNFWDGPVLRAQ